MHVHRLTIACVATNKSYLEANSWGLACTDYSPHVMQLRTFIAGWLTRIGLELSKFVDKLNIKSAWGPEWQKPPGVTTTLACVTTTLAGVFTVAG